MFSLLVHIVVIGLPLFLIATAILRSIRIIGPTQVGLVIKRFSSKKLSDDSPVAFNGEAGYQAELLMPGWRFKLWPIYDVKNHPWVQIPAGEIGVVISQIGRPLPIGAKSAKYNSQFGNFTNLKGFVNFGGQKGVQRPVLSPGTLAPIHPVGFLVLTVDRMFGVPVSEEMRKLSGHEGTLKPGHFGLTDDSLRVTRISPVVADRGRTLDVVGLITALEGDPLPSGDIASRIGGFDDIAKFESDKADDSKMIEVILGSKNTVHNNYQDFQAFLDNGGKIGMQHDPLLYGAFNLNPFLISVEITPMLVVEQGEVAVVKSYVGLPTQDTSGLEFKFGSLVRPGHRGIWREPLRTGKYAINPRCYSAELVPTCILTLNWAEATSQAHQLDANLKAIVAKSREGFVFKIDLQVQIHVPDVKAPRVISIVGTMSNLVNEVLQASVGNHFRDTLQALQAVKFIETRQQVQEAACAHIREQLDQYEVETRGVYIQDVILPEQLVTVLTEREIANQRIATLQKQKEAEDNRILTEASRGRADQQAALAKAEVGVSIKEAEAKARKAEADGEATYIRQTGTAKGAEVEAVGLAHAKAFEAQKAALGPQATSLVNVVKALSDGHMKVMPEILVAGGNGNGSLDGALATLMSFLGGISDKKAESAAKK